MAQQGKEFAAESDNLSTVPGPTQCKLTSMGVPWYTHTRAHTLSGQALLFLSLVVTVPWVWRIFTDL